MASYDSIVVGSGLAGLTFALRAAERGPVAVLTKAAVTDSNTQWAQGGIAAAVGEADDWGAHERDTMIAGAFLNDLAAVQKLVSEAPAAIDWLISLGARFDRNATGLALGREGGHSAHRIVHHGDSTGWEIERAVSEAVRAHPNIEVFERAFATRLLRRGGRCVGVDAVLDAGEGETAPRAFLGRATLLATGGCGRVYTHTTNPRVATGDGVALGLAAGAAVADMEFMQFHPTTLYHPQMRSFLITEAVRGAGGTLRNHLGSRFMYGYDERLELAPRDVVARAIDAEMKRLRTWCVYLDATHLRPEDLRHEFPTIYEKLLTIELPMEREWIPVVPAQHYSCGGVVTDLDARTDLPGLYAAGEVARSGVHGANRLASNSLLEAIVFAGAAAEASAGEPPLAELPLADLPLTDLPEGTGTLPKCVSEADSIRLRNAMRHTMTQNAGIVRTDAGLTLAVAEIGALLADYENLPSAPYSQHARETHNLLLCAAEVATGALARRENVGLHFNADLA